VSPKRTRGRPRVAVLGGGPDSEREVSLQSSRAIAAALIDGGAFDVSFHEVGRVTAADLGAIDADTLFPVLHGGFGEGGPLQDLLEGDGRPYVGSGPAAARRAMDKVATKLTALANHVPTPDSGIFDVRDEHSFVGLPAVLKPVHEGSSVGVHLCRKQSEWDKARAEAAGDMRALPGRAYMVERLIKGAELTVGVLDPGGDHEATLPPIRIQPAAAFYNYEAKYTRDDTKYTVDPDLPPGVADTIRSRALTMARALGVRHLCRVDFLLDEAGDAWLLEVNTMPGFTSHSLFPMAARKAGTEMPALCVALVGFAIRDGARPTRPKKKM